MKAHVEKDTCIGCGLCTQICPEVFKMNENDVSEVIAETVPSGAEDSCREAASSCPVEAITIIEEE